MYYLKIRDENGPINIRCATVADARNRLNRMLREGTPHLYAYICDDEAMEVAEETANWAEEKIEEQEREVMGMLANLGMY